MPFSSNLLINSVCSVHTVHIPKCQNNNSLPYRKSGVRHLLARWSYFSVNGQLISPLKSLLYCIVTMFLPECYSFIMCANLKEKNKQTTIQSDLFPRPLQILFSMISTWLCFILWVYLCVTCTAGERHRLSITLLLSIWALNAVW